MPSKDPARNERPSSQARERFRSFLERWYEGKETDFERWCEGHKDLEQELRGLHAQWRHVEEVLGRLRTSESLASRLHAQYGECLHPDLSLTAPPEPRTTDQTTDLLERMVGRG